MSVSRYLFSNTEFRLFLCRQDFVAFGTHDEEDMLTSGHGILCHCHLIALLLQTSPEYRISIVITRHQQRLKGRLG